MRRFLIVAAVLGLALVAVACGSDGTTTASPPPNEPSAQAPASSPLITKTVEAGAVTVKIDPVRVDATGAEFKVSFDTHSVNLDFDVARNAALTVGGAPWSGATWSGDGPDGHHRSGTIRFGPGGPAQGAAVLSLGGLPAPVNATWTLGG